MPKKNTTAAQIERWRHGSAGFFAWLDDTKPMIPSEKGGYEPYAVPNDEVRQEIKNALDGPYSTIVLSWPRRHGKTIVAGLIITWRFLTRKTQTIAMVANSEKQATDTAFRTVKTILEQTPFTKSMIIDGVLKIGAERIDYATVGNTITGYPASAAALYGKKLSVAQISELHAAKTDEVFQTLASSTIDTEDGLVIVDSTVGPTSSPLHGLYQIAQRGADPSLYFSYISYRDLADAIARGPRWIKAERLRSRAAQMLPAIFGTQHLNLWGSASNALFTADVIKRCRDSYALDVKAVTAGAAHVVGAGLDRAYGFSLHGDATVSTAVLKMLIDDDHHFFVLASDQIAFSSEAGIKKAFTRYARDFGMSRAAIESYNAQDVASWAAGQTFESEVVHPTAERQSAVFTALHLAALEGRLHVHPTFTKLASEMGSFEYKLDTGTKGTIAKFEAAKGAHDDHVYSLAWAIYALRDVELNPYEVTGIHCDAIGPVARLCVLNGGEMVPSCHDGCRSFQSVANLYKQYRSRSGVTGMPIEQFFASRVVNTGSHSVKR
ncbi:MULTISPECIES: terminase large subunit domain-containing protein [unclassified Inquilinus]|uniref:terminase large subunit domain-containing protein n=1 Tax=unclassified Inquilinus TaxID=2645927 RepID=UPI003F91A918